jgi:hypothetical protein
MRIGVYWAKSKFLSKCYKKRPKCGEQSKWLNLPSAKIVFTADTLKKKEFDAGFG